MFKLEMYLKLLKAFQISRMDSEPTEGEDSYELRSRGLSASAKKTRPTVKTPVVICEIADSIEPVEQATITTKKMEVTDKPQENPNECGQGNAQPSSEEDSKNTSLETIMVDSSMDTSASMEGITVEEVWQIKEGEEFKADRPVLFQPQPSPGQFKHTL